MILEYKRAMGILNETYTLKEERVGMNLEISFDDVKELWNEDD